MLYEVITPSGVNAKFLKGNKMDFNFELDTDDNTLYGSIDLGDTDGGNSPYRIAIRSGLSVTDRRGGIFRVFIDRHVGITGTSYWSKEKYKVLLNLNEDFSIKLIGQRITGDFEWIIFYFTRTEDGLYLKKVSKPNTRNACNLGNDNLDRIVLQEGLVLNNFQITVINNLVGRDKKNYKLKYKGL